MADMIMSDARKEAKKNKASKQDTYDRAVRLQKVYPHLRQVTVKFLMWAQQRFGIKKVEEIAAMNLTSFTFKQKIQILAR